MEGRPWCHTQETDDGKTRMTARERTACLRLKHRGEAGGRAQRGTWWGRAVGVTGESGHCPGTHVHLPTEEQRAFICILESLLRLLFKEPMTAEQVYGGGVGGRPLGMCNPSGPRPATTEARQGMCPMQAEGSVAGLMLLLPSSVQFSRLVVSDSLRPHGLQHARPPCTSPTPRVYSNSCPLSR